MAAIGQFESHSCIIIFFQDIETEQEKGSWWHEQQYGHNRSNGTRSWGLFDYDGSDQSDHPGHSNFKQNTPRWIYKYTGLSAKRPHPNAPGLGWGIRNIDVTFVLAPVVRACIAKIHSFFFSFSLKKYKSEMNIQLNYAIIKYFSAYIAIIISVI